MSKPVRVLCIEPNQHACTPGEDDKKLMGNIAAGTDVEEQRLQTNLVLADSRERYRAIIEDARVIGWEYDWASERFTYVSGHAREITGYTIQDWYQKGSGLITCTLTTGTPLSLYVQRRPGGIRIMSWNIACLPPMDR